MQPGPLLAAVMAVAIVNGIFSPFVVVTSQVMIVAIMPMILLGGPSLVAFVGSLLGATATVALAGIPAALFERATGRTETDTLSYAIWFAAALVISFPALIRAATLML